MKKLAINKSISKLTSFSISAEGMQNISGGGDGTKEKTNSGGGQGASSKLGGVEPKA